MIINAPGIYDMPAATYHADPVETPSLSCSIGETLIDHSPRHAWFAHPRLNPDHQPEATSEAMDEGTALHALILENASLVAVVEAKDWRTKDAQEMRKHAREIGKVPILAHRWERIQGCANAIRVQLADHEIGDILENGVAEQTIVWTEQTASGVIWCRCRVDWRQEILNSPLYDLKTTATSANPETWGRRMDEDGRAMRAAFYLRGCRAVGLKPSAYRFLVIERNPPHAISVVECSGASLAEGEKDMFAAMDLWGFCLRDDYWPGYPPFISRVDPSPWSEQRREERGMRFEQLRARGYRLPPARSIGA